MFFHSMLLGEGLPRGTLCITFDDGPGRTDSPSGPGPRTAELGAYLHRQGVPATFFAVGKFASSLVDTIGHLKSLGHLVANHTYDHPSLPAFVEGGGDAIGQLARTAGSIRSGAGGPVTYFRPPYGDWRLRGQVLSNVAPVLNRSEVAGTHVGPVGWDIDAGDTGFWRDGRSARDCASAYIEAVERAGRGIVLLHDSTADIDELRPKNRSYELARLLIPELRGRGYRFVRLDEVPQVASAALVSFPVTLLACDGRLVTNPPSGAEVTLAPRSGADSSAIWGVVDRGADRWALRSPSGRFLSIKRGGEVLADALAPDERETFSVERRSGMIALRTAAGAYLTSDPRDADRLMVSPSSPDERPQFRVEYAE